MIQDFFHIESRRDGEGGECIFTVTLNPDSVIYQGHFPGYPVTPGVCSVEMVRECASLLAGHPLRITGIRKCRFSVLITPSEVRKLEVSLKMTAAGEGAYDVYGALRREGTDYVKIVMHACHG